MRDNGTKKKGSESERDIKSKKDRCNEICILDGSASSLCNGTK